MWKEIITAAIEYIDSKTETTKKQVKGAIQSAIEAPSRMESRYDSTREEHEMKAAAIGGNLEGLRLLKEFMVGLLSGHELQNNDRIVLGSLVKLDYRDGDEDEEYLLIVPNNGGDEIEVQGTQVRTVSIDSPLGSALIGHSMGEKVNYTPDRIAIMVRIVEIQKG